MAFLQVEFFSHTLHMAVSADVILPQPTRREIGIDSGTRKDGKCPVLWLLHGASDDHTTWQRRTSIERYVAPLGLAVVMPSVHLSRYAKMAHGGDFYHYVADELPETMRSFFPLSDCREDNFIAGNSMGGFGAMKIGINHPDRYAAIGCFSAGANSRANLLERFQDPDSMMVRRQQMIFGNPEQIDDLEDTFLMAEHNKSQPVLPRIFHSCGRQDFLLEKARQTRDFFQAMPGNPYSYVYDEHEGIHEWDYWDAHIGDFLRFIQKNSFCRL